MYVSLQLLEISLAWAVPVLLRARCHHGAQYMHGETENVATGALPRMKDLEVRTLEQIYNSLKGKLLFDPIAQARLLKSQLLLFPHTSHAIALLK